MSHDEMVSLTGDGALVLGETAVVSAGDVPSPRGRSIRKPAAQKIQRSGIRMQFTSPQMIVACYRLRNAGIDPAVIAREAVVAAAAEVRKSKS